MKRLLRYVRTLRYLRPRQAAYYVIRRFLPASGTPDVPTTPRLRPGVRVNHPFPGNPGKCSDYEFIFLNRKKSFTGSQVDWKSDDMPKLWRYNLHYFDYALDYNRTTESLRRLIMDWIDRNPPKTEDAWEPYTVSLRIVNWIKLFLRPEFRPHVTSQLLKSLYQQALWLEQNIEYHILANHYLKNGKALYFAGVFFEGSDADRWLENGFQVMTEECEEQILPDGGHYERSPMYHSIVLEDCLDVLNLVATEPNEAGSCNTSSIRIKTLSALEYLNDICMPDGEIPLFNDSAFHIARQPDEIIDYGRQIVGYVRHQHDGEFSVIQKGKSGYYIMRHGDDMMIVDCGPVGPDYQPGHAHCDMLSYELAIDGRRVIVDSGVYDYEKGKERAYARSTMAHNTVSVDGGEQSEVWGLFRVGRRARPIGATARLLDGKNARFEGAHDGFRFLSGRVTHKRTIDYNILEGWSIQDELSGAGHHRMDVFIHLHPDMVACLSDNIVTFEDVGGKCVGTVELARDAEITLESGWYYPEFGTKIDNVMIRIRKSGNLPLKTLYKIRRLPLADAS